MARPSIKQEAVNELAEEALELACDNEEVLIKFRALCDSLLEHTRLRKHRLSIKGRIAGFPHARPELMERVG